MTRHRDWPYDTGIGRQSQAPREWTARLREPAPPSYKLETFTTGRHYIHVELGWFFLVLTYYD